MLNLTPSPNPNYKEGVVSYADYDGSNGSSSSFNFTVDIGAYTPSRKAIVAIAYRGTASNNITTTSFSLAGVNGSLLARSNRSSGSDTNAVEFWLVDLKTITATSGTLSFTTSNAVARGIAGVWATYDLRGTLFSQNNFTGSSGDPDLSLNTTQGSCIFGAAYTANGTSHTWTGLTENFESMDEFGAGNGFSGASARTTVAQTPRAVSFAVGGSETIHSSLVICVR